jgi:hypothetical protein
MEDCYQNGLSYLPGRFNSMRTVILAYRDRRKHQGETIRCYRFGRLRCRKISRSGRNDRGRPQIVLQSATCAQITEHRLAEIVYLSFQPSREILPVLCVRASQDDKED